jgi:hypothetical protein
MPATGTIMNAIRRTLSSIATASLVLAPASSAHSQATRDTLREREARAPTAQAATTRAAASQSQPQTTTQLQLTRSVRQLQREIASSAVADTVAQPAHTAVPTGTPIVPPTTAPEPATRAPAVAEQPTYHERPPLLESGKIYTVEPSAVRERTFKALVEPKVRALAGDKPIASPTGIFVTRANDGADVQFKPFVYVGDPLTWQREERSFRGSIFVGVAALDDEAAAAGLSKAVVFQTLDPVAVTPDDLEVANAGPPYRQMTVEVPTAARAVKIRMVAQNAGGELSIEVPVAPVIVVEPVNPQIQGYGLGTTMISVMAAGLENPEGQVVTLIANPRGTFEPDQVVLDRTGNARARLRSDGVGQRTIRATTAGAASVEQVVEFAAPMETISASLFGGVLGGLIRVLPNRRAGQGGKLLVALIVAVLIGLLGFALYAIGVNLTPIQPTVTQGAIVVLAMSGVSAYLGVKWLKGLESTG